MEPTLTEQEEMVWAYLDAAFDDLIQQYPIDGVSRDVLHTYFLAGVAAFHQATLPIVERWRSR